MRHLMSHLNAVFCLELFDEIQMQEVTTILYKYPWNYPFILPPRYQIPKCIQVILEK